jgi:hypothetical protein
MDIFNQIAEATKPQKTNNIIAIGNFYDRTIVIEVTDMNPRKENVFQGKCIASDCELNEVGDFSSNWDKNNFTFYHKI